MVLKHAFETMNIHRIQMYVADGKSKQLKYMKGLVFSKMESVETLFTFKTNITISLFIL